MQRLRHRRRALGAAVALAATLVGCGHERRAASDVVFTECRLPKLSAAARCASIDVPENRDVPDGRKVTLFVAVLPATTLTPKDDPLVVLAGGPGQAATSLAPFASRLLEVRRTRDVLLIDQRGTGRSSPLACKAFVLDDDPAQALDTDPVPRANACLDELRATGVDITQYTTHAWVADLEAVRRALGIERWNLWGGSYGTRVAQEYVRRHAPHVRTLILDGVAPPSLKVSSGVWASREQALDALFAACAASAACGRSHPGLRANLDRLALALGPDGRDVIVADPRTGAGQSLRLTFDAVLTGLQPLVYLPELAVLIPEILERAANGDFAPLFATAQMVTGELAEQTNVALHYAVTCAEDAPRVTGDDRQRLSALRSGPLAAKVLAVCDAWPRAKVAPEALSPVQSDVPTLLLSGALDPVTPPAYADEVAKALRNAKHVVAGGYGHIVSPHACGPRLIAAFVESAAFEALPAPCIEHFEKSTRPPLWPDHLAPVP
jgi:pimeloyl-ACP methyl ester carboxylesterase